MTKSRNHRSSAAPQPEMTEGRKKWEQAAFRRGMFFILLPAILPFPLVTTFHWAPRSLALTLSIVIGWMLVVLCSVAYGRFRIRKYKRDHPFIT